MDQDPKRGDNKNSSSLVWFALLIVLALLSISMLLLSQNQQKLSVNHFRELIDNTKYIKGGSDDGKLAPDHSGKVLITEKDSKRVIEISEPRDLIIGKEISGSAFYKVIEGTGKDKERSKITFQVTAVNSDSYADYESELLERNINFEGEPPPTFLQRYGFIFITTGLILLVFLLMMRKLGGAGGPMQFGRSRGRMLEEELGISFDDVAGIDEAVEEVNEVVDFLRTPEKYQKLGGRIPRGVLLVGPPGTGKTLLAKAIAGEAGVPFFSLSGSDFVEMFVGVGAARVRDMFQTAQAKSPCIIFIDELDALGKSRTGSAVGGHDEREQTLNALLVEMDGFESNSGVIVMGATNRPETLDQALMRPGRFDRHVLVDRPDVRGREEILKVHVKDVKLEPDVDLQKIAAISPGFVGADLANLVNEAALLAARKEKSKVGMAEFNEGVERAAAGLEKKQRVMNVEEKQRVAYHESGHALVAYSLPNTDPVHKVSIIPRGLAALGYTMQRPEQDRYLMTQSELESQLQILLAGTITEEIIYKDISTGAQNDLERCTDIARAMVMQYGMSRLGRINYKQDRSSPFLAGSSAGPVPQQFSEETAREIDLEVKRIIDESVEKVRHILDVRSKALEALTQRLIDVESVDHDELKRIVDENSSGPIVVPGTDVPREERSVIQTPDADEERAAQ
jgi:cell division protease FtsH